MSKVLVDRELLERALHWREGDAGDSGRHELEAVLAAQPAEAEGVEVVAFLMKPDMYEPYVSLRRDSRCPGSIEPLMTVSQHTAALSAVTAERDALLAEREGKVLVPTEPTIEMIAALGFGGDVALAIGHAAISEEVEQTYKAMLSAALAAKGA